MRQFWRRHRPLLETDCEIIPAIPPAMKLELARISFGLLCPSSCAANNFMAYFLAWCSNVASARLTSYDPNLTADSGATLMTLRPFPSRCQFLAINVWKQSLPAKRLLIPPAVHSSLHAFMSGCTACFVAWSGFPPFTASRA